MHKKRDKFFLFGMGNRKKFVYKQGQLIEFPSMKTIYDWNISDEKIIPDEYRVILTTVNFDQIIIEENEAGLFVVETSSTTCLDSTFIRLPSFEGHPFAKIMRILHHEICINILDGKPLPSIFVYDTPWYRDAAMMTIALEKTGNLHLIKDWADKITSCYDKNNAGHEEPDNLGQLLYIFAKTGNSNHPLIPKIIAEAKKRIVDGALTGLSDFAKHPVYQTKWLKMGLDALQLDSSWVKIPKVEDSYNALFWMDVDENKNQTIDECNVPYDHEYPYLSWAKEHTKYAIQKESYDGLCEEFLFKIENAYYPISSETNASQADYDKQNDLFPNLAKEKCSAPHSWHAAEMFLFLDDYVAN